MPDSDKLQAFTRDGSQEAFAVIVRRYAGPIFSACWRQLGDRQLAEDATQAVFLALAQRASRFGRGTVLSGWLFQAARYVCANMRRIEQRRRHHEHAAASASSERAMPDADPDDELTRTLDDAVASLRSRDRDLVLLRYMRGLSIPDVAAELGLSETAARKGLSRAVERLRVYFAEHAPGVTPAVACAALAGETTTPFHLADSILASIRAGGSPAAATLAKGALVAMSTASTKTVLASGIATLLIAGTVTVGVLAAGSKRGAAPPHAGSNATAVADPTPEEATRLAEAGDYPGAIEQYAAWLATLSVEEYRDKKDFEWLIDTHEKRQPARAGAKVDYGPLIVAAEKAIEKSPVDPAIVVWRANRLLASIAERRGDKAAIAEYIGKAIDAYPRVDYPDPMRLSSIQHLYNRRAMLIAEAKGIDDAEKFVLESFENDDRFEYFFWIQWQQQYAKHGTPERFADLAKRVVEVYGLKAERDKTNAARYEEAADELRKAAP